MERLIQPVDRRDLLEWRQFASIREDLIVVIGAEASKHVILSRVPNPAQHPEVYRNLLTERQHQVETYLDVPSPLAGEGFAFAKIAGNVRKAQWPILGAVLDLLDLEAALCAEPATAVPLPTGAQQKPDDPFAELREFARTKLKGQERAVIEALCDAGGELPIADLAVEDGVSWDDPVQGFKNAQRRLNRKLKLKGWRLERQNNAGFLKAVKGLKRVQKDPN
jgi:hypothetical protein